MDRRKKQKVKMNDIASVESLLQETYIDACGQITEAQKIINILTLSTTPEDVDDITKIAREKSNALKIKDSGIKIKLDISKLMTEVIKHNGSVEDAIESRVSGGSASLEGFKDLREWIKANANKNE